MISERNGFSLINFADQTSNRVSSSLLINLLIKMCYSERGSFVQEELKLVLIKQ